MSIKETNRLDPYTLSGRKWRYGINATVLTIAVVAVVILLNVIAGQHQLRLDVTRTKEHSLSNQTHAILADLKDTVKLTAFLVEGESQLIRDLVREYQLASSNIQVEIVDPIREPDRARAYDLTDSTTVVFESRNRSEKVTSSELFDYGSISHYDPYQTPDFVGEQAFTSAVLKVTSETTEKAYFLSGHAELSLKGELSQITESLRSEGYGVEECLLAVKGAVPEDASLLVVAGPMRDLTSAESEALHDYLCSGGRLMVLVDPPIDLDAPLPNLVALLERWGIEMREDIVMDPDRFVVPSITWSVPNLEYHPVTRPLITAGIPVVLPYARSLGHLQEAGDRLSIVTLLSTSSSAWGETALWKSSMPTPDGDDPRGPLALGIAVTAAIDDSEDSVNPAENASGENAPVSNGETRVIAIGDSSFISNDYLEFGNRDLFLNAVNWLTGVDVLVSIRPKPLDLEPLYMTGDQFAMVFYGTTIVIPVLVLMAGAGVYLRRRNL